MHWRSTESPGSTGEEMTELSRRCSTDRPRESRSNSTCSCSAETGGARRSLGLMSLVVLGIPWDANSSYLHGCAAGPEAIRSALHSGSGNNATEHGMSVVPELTDLGDLELQNAVGDLDANWADADVITDAVDAQMAAGNRVISLGGDHAVTYPILRGVAKHSYEQADRFGVQMIGARQLDQFDASALDGPIYLTVDLDGLDPAVAPGVSHHEPGGLTVRELLDVIDALPGPIVGADIVELNPSRDLVDMTAMVGAKLLKEIAGRMLTVG
jgi:arginase